ncbi:MAG: tRNA lysidine(34) synthetase TilS [Candidatus Omnitrophica bacterium]|nr:tRNA lysidine(34) synthetase TilS [Candidatus Omnitrophota bacterium]MBU1869531.1 tRNA lysidine(34) synthetase TilS [Candidatus Omnitrophota bacterium]
MILDKLRLTIRKYDLLKKGDRLVVGVSGGPDSLALLYLLKALEKEFRLNLHIAHVDHMLRKESFKDRALVEREARSLGIAATFTRIDINKIGKKGSLEEIARNARFGFLFRLAKELDANKIALGHNLDDQAETVLMRILRGAGMYGLAGIIPKRRFGHFEIIRPLIEIRRKEIDSFLRRKRIKPIIDATNSEEVFLRNKIRHKLLPYLEKEYNKNIREVLTNMAQSLGVDYDYLSLVVDRTASRLGNRLDLDKLRKIHPSIQRLIFRQAIARLKSDTRSIDFRHIIEIEDLIAHRPVNSVVDLPKRVSVKKKKNLLVFYLRNSR